MQSFFSSDTLITISVVAVLSAIIYYIIFSFFGTANNNMSRRDYSGDLVPYRGAGGTPGGVGRYFIGMIMFLGGIYLLLRSVAVHNFGWGYGLFRVGGANITTGYILIPFMFGVGLIFYNYRNILGWFLAIGSLVMLIFGIITSVNFTFQGTSAFDLLIILILMVGGLGLVLSSLSSRRSQF